MPRRAISQLLRPSRSLAARITGSFLALFAVVIGVVSFAAYRSAETGLQTTISGQIDAIAALKENELNQWVEDQLRLVRVVADLPGVAQSLSTESEYRNAAYYNVLNRVMQSSRDFEEVFLLTAVGGRVVASTNQSNVGRFFTTSQFFLEGRNRPAIQTVYQSPLTQRPTLTVSAPIKGLDDDIAYVLAAHLSLHHAGGLTEQAEGPVAGSRAYLVTKELQFVTVQKFGLDEYARGVWSDGIDAATAGKSGFAAYEDYRGVPVIGAYRWMEKQNLALLIEVPESVAFAPIGGLAKLIALIGVAAILTAMVVSRLLARTITRPVAAVAAAAAMVADGDFAAFAAEHGQDEVGDMARSFNAMTSRLRGLYSDLEGQVDATSRALEALEQSRSLLQSIIDNSSALIAVAGLDGQLILANQRLNELLGNPEEEQPAGPILSLVPTEVRDEWITASHLAAELGEVVHREVEWPDPDGAKTYLCAWFPLIDDASNVFATGLIATDLTERKQMEEERLRLEAQFRHTQKLESLGILAGGIAHDFNNILAAILGHADLAAECLPDEPDEVAEHLSQVVSASQRAAELTNQMLAYAGRASFRVETVDLNQAIHTMSELVGVSLPKKVTLSTELHSTALPVRADPAQISQILMNLITNGAQAMGEEAGSVVISTRLVTRGRVAPEAVLQVKDSGCGMDAATKELIFDPFFTTKEAGRGLGLAAVSGIIHGLGGRIDVDSRVGVGTTFTVTLPLAIQAAPETPTDPVREESPSKGGTLLVVDDEESVRRVATRALQRQGFKVLEASDGVEALDVYRLQAHQIEGVVLDLSMPGMSGREVFEAIAAVDPKLPVLFTSGYDATDAAGDILTEDHIRYLQKPYRPTALSDAVESLLTTRSRVARAAV